MNTFMKKILRVLSLMLIAVTLSVLFTAYDDDDFELSKNLDIYHTLMRELNIYYVDKTASGELIKTSIDAMLKTLDPYTVYIPETRIEDYRFMTTGEYGGLGFTSVKGEEYILIDEIYENYPAHKAGLKAGDLVIEVDGHSTKGKSTADVGMFTKGTPGSEVVLKIRRNGINEDFDVTLIREKIEVDNVPYYGMLNHKTGYIMLSGFTQNAGDEVKKALNDLIENKSAKSIVLDLRSNPGGLLIEAVNIVNLFVDKGVEVVSMRGQVSRWNNVFRASYEPVSKEIPLAVIVNSKSASASEIVSGAIQDLDRGVVIGQRSFGKGLVQTTRPLSYNAQLKITTAKYYIPSGRCIQALDYSHRRPDGGVGRMPDSLITEFTTKNGRTVYDGGGIRPDIKVEVLDSVSIINQMKKKRIIFDYATQYSLTHDSIVPPELFTISDAEYRKFIEFVKNKNFDYKTESQKQLEQLIEMAKRENYFSAAKNEFESLQKKIDSRLLHDIEKFKKEIKKLLRKEIVSRYYFENGEIKASLTEDSEILKAIEILNEPEMETYKKTLSPDFKTDKE